MNNKLKSALKNRDNANKTIKKDTIKDADAKIFKKLNKDEIENGKKTESKLKFDGPSGSEDGYRFEGAAEFKKKDRGEHNYNAHLHIDVKEGFVMKLNNAAALIGALNKAVAGKDSSDDYTDKDKLTINTLTHNNKQVLDYLMNGGKPEGLVIVKPKGRTVAVQGKYEGSSIESDVPDETRFPSDGMVSDRAKDPVKHQKLNVIAQGSDAYYSGIDKMIKATNYPEDKPFGDAESKGDDKYNIVVNPVALITARADHGPRKAHQLQVYTPEQYEKEHAKAQNKAQAREAKKDDLIPLKELDPEKLSFSARAKLRKARYEAAAGNSKPMETWYGANAEKYGLQNPYENKESRRTAQKTNPSSIADSFDAEIAKEKASLKGKGGKESKKGNLRRGKKYDKLPDGYNPEPNSPPELGHPSPVKAALANFAEGVIQGSITEKLSSSDTRQGIAPQGGGGSFISRVRSIKGPTGPNL